MLFKNPIILVLPAIVILLCQAAASYWSFQFIQEGEFVLGFSLFLLVPVLALALVYGYILFRKKRSGRKPGADQ